MPRAIEYRRPLLNCTNSGVTAFLSPTGERLAVDTDLFHQTFLLAEVHSDPEITPYARLGDVFGWICTVLVLAGIATGLKRAP